MGGGGWDTSTYSARATAKAAAGKSTFDYHDTAVRTGNYSVHKDLDPKWVAGAGSPFAGKIVRESRDSDEHPTSVPIIVVFDVTGSMGSIPRVLQEKLPKLHTLLLAKGYVEHPQILFAATGDAYTDRTPLQIGQFESDNRMDENLENFILEGGGGGQTAETYNLAAYFMARHTATDAWEKRGKKGYCFFIGDERNYSSVRKNQVVSLMGDDGLESDVETTTIFAELQEKYDTYFLFAAQGSYPAKEILEGGVGGQIGWRRLLNERALVLEDAEAVCETIALVIGLGEGAIDLDAGLADLTDVGTDAGTVGAVGKALAMVGAGATALATSSGGDLDLDGDDGAARL